MQFDEYQKQALTTMIRHDNAEIEKSILALGIAGEAGEVADKWKKILIYYGGKITEDDLSELKKELGDVLWYIALFADRLNLSLEAIAKDNLTKVLDRQARQTIQGSGDNR